MSHRLHGVCGSALLAAALLAQEPAPKFDVNTKLVLVPFHVQRGKYFAADMQPSDFVLHEDGHPRQFSTFEGPNTAHPLPLELILLFDTTVLRPDRARTVGNWDPKSAYEFRSNWDESITREVLQKNGMDIRVSVYHYSGRQFERLCAASSDPPEIVHTFQALLDPISPGKGELTLLPGNKVLKPPFGPPDEGWLIESVVATLKDAVESPVAARRILIVFTTGSGGTFPETSLERAYASMVDLALTLNIPINPVIMHYARFLGRASSGAPGPGGVFSTVDTPKELADKLGIMGSTAYKVLPWFTSTGEKSGGEALIPPRLDRETFAGILGLVRDATLSQYIVGFSPDAAAKPKKHSLAVTLSSKSKGKLVGGEKNGVVY